MNNQEIESKSAEELVEGYRNQAISYAEAEASGDHIRVNKAHDEIALIYRELRRRGPASQRALLPLLHDNNSWVRCWVAAHALEFAPALGENALLELVRSKPSVVRNSAEMTLTEWRAGRLSFP